MARRACFLKELVGLSLKFPVFIKEKVGLEAGLMVFFIGSGSTLKARARLGLEKNGLIPPHQQSEFLN